MLIKPVDIYKNFIESCRRVSSKDALLFINSDGTCCSQTYLLIYQKSLVFARFLRNNGIGRGDKVGVLLENRPEFSWVSLGVFANGSILVPLDTQYSTETLNHLLRHCGAAVLVSTRRLCSSRPDVKTRCICIDADDFQGEIEDDGIEDIENEACQADNFFDEDAAFFYTSGTTDHPKAVVLTHRNLLADIESIDRSGLVFEKDVVLSVLPLHHTYAFTVTLLLPLLKGMTIAYPKGLSSIDLVSCIKQTCVTVFVGVPQIFSMIHRTINDRMSRQGRLVRSAINVAGGVNIASRKHIGINVGSSVFKKIHQLFGPSLRVMVSGGARLDPLIAEDFYRWGFTLVEGYGLTETAPVVAFSLPERPKFGSVGLCLE